MVRQATILDGPDLEAIHAQAFDHPWTTRDIVELMMTGAVALMTDDGFILVRDVAGEAEVLTLAVVPAARRHGLGRALLDAAIAQLGPSELFLEVAADNMAAIGLYQAAGFRQMAVRRGYYARPGGAVDALTMKRTPQTA